MKWSDEFATGLERIDEQHRMLFKIAEDFRLALDEGGGERTYPLLLEVLYEYARAHFQFEETCMEKYACPLAETNREAHAGFIRMLADYRQRLDSIGFRSADAHALVSGLDRWLSNHICRIDIDLRRAVRGQ